MAASRSWRQRLRPIPDTDRFELFYWSNVKGRWTTFGSFGRMKLMLESLRVMGRQRTLPQQAEFVHLPGAELDIRCYK
jgi:hypothetical protein